MTWTAADTTYCGLKEGARVRLKDGSNYEIMVIKTVALGLVLCELIDPRNHIGSTFKWIRLKDLEVRLGG